MSIVSFRDVTLMIRNYCLRKGAFLILNVPKEERRAGKKERASSTHYFSEIALTEQFHFIVLRFVPMKKGRCEASGRFPLTRGAALTGYEPCELT